MKIRYIVLCLILVAGFSGCTQAQPETNNQITPPVVEEPIADELAPLPLDYEGVWLRTGTYLNGELENTASATWTLNRTDYTSVGTCANSGKVISEGNGTVTVTLDSTNCPGVTAGGSVTYTYEISLDKDRNIETMTTYTGPVMETYDRQS